MIESRGPKKSIYLPKIKYDIDIQDYVAAY